MRMLALLILSLLNSSVYADNWYNISHITVIDGDTVTADVDTDLGISLKQEQIRLLGFDAWELSKRRKSVDVDNAEVASGKLAAAALRGLLLNEKTLGVQVSPQKHELRDNYGRLLLHMRVIRLFDKKSPDDEGVIDVAKWMKKNGHDRNSEQPDDRQLFRVRAKVKF